MFDNLLGRALDRYTILRKLGEDRLGTIFRGHDPNFQRDVAIKILNPSLYTRPNFKDEFIQAARAAVRLDHPNLVQVYDFGQEQDLHYLVMEYIPGESLERMLEELRHSGRWILLYEAVFLVRQMALALEYLRTQGAPPRSVRPANIMVKPVQSDRLPYLTLLTDLGLSPLFEGAGGNLAAAPAYVSPEEATGTPTDRRSDVYMLGILLYELATGQLPFPIQNASEAAAYHSRQPVTPPRAIRPDLPEALERTILTALQKSPDARYAGPAALAAELERAGLQAESIMTAPPTLERGASLLAAYHQDQPEGPTVVHEPARFESAVATQAGPAAPVSWQRPVDLILENAQLSVEPGASVQTAITLRNRGLSEGYFRVTVEGAPQAWVLVSPELVQLGPGEQQNISLTIQPARSPQSRAGRYPLIVRAVNQQDPNQVGEARGSLTVVAFSRFSSRLHNQTLQVGETGQVSISNLGNTQNTFSINFHDPEDMLVFTLPQPQLRLAEGQTAVAEFRADLRQARWIGSERNHPFTAAVTSSMGETQTHGGEVVSHALVPAWIVGALVILFLCIAGSFALFLARSGLEMNGATATVVAAQTGTAEAFLSTLQAETATAQFLAGVNQATQTAASQLSTQVAGTALAATATSGAATATSGAATATSAGATSSAATVVAATLQVAGATAQAAGTATAAAFQATQQATLAAGATSAAATSIAAGAAAGTATEAARQTATAGAATAQAAAGLTATAGAAGTATAAAGASLTATAGAAAAATSAAATAQAGSATQTAAARVRVAYIYSNGNQEVADFQKFLLGSGFLVDPIVQSAITGTDFAAYRAILVGPGTGHDQTWGDDNGDQMNRIVSSGRPVLGIGEGGLAFFRKANVSFGANSAVSDASSVVAVDPGSPVWSTPNAIPIPSNGVVALYNANTRTGSASIQTPANGQVLIGRLPEDATRYPILREGDRYLLWGFSGGPLEMTAGGQQFFVNILRSLLPKQP